MGKVKILVVEDEIIIARELEARLQGLGYEVVGTAASGREALALTAELQPDLVLMDIVLKGDMDGIEAAVQIRRQFRIPVIYVTAFTDKTTLERAQATQPYAYLVKPFAERELYANIEMTLYRHRVESKFRAMEVWFAASMERIADGVLGTTTLEGNLNYINPAAEKLTGWSKAEALGRRASEIFRLKYSTGEETLANPILQTLTDGLTVELNDVLLVTNTGEHIPVNYVGACLRDNYGEPIGVVLVIRDLREQKRSEQQLWSAQVDLEAQRLAALNLAQDEMAARLRAERAEREVRELNEELEQRVQDRTAELEETNQSLQQEIYVRKQAQVRLSEQARLATLAGDTGTALTRASTLRAMLQHCAAAVVEHLDAAFARIWILNHQEQVLELQASAGLYTHLDGGHGRVPVGRLKIGRIAQEKQPHLTNDVCKDPHVSDPEWARREGLVAFAGHPLLVDGDLVGVVALFARQPLSEATLKALAIVADNLALGIKRKQAEESLQQALREVELRAASLAAANKELDAFSYSVSHDLRAPLRAIDGFSRILLEEYASHLPDEGQRYLQMARENTQRMGQLIDDLLAFSRLGRQQLKKRPLELTGLVQTVLAELREENAERQVAVSVGALPACQADAALLKQVFTNLLANAFKFTRAQPAARIEIGCRNGEPAGPPVYFIKDNGAGFDMHYASKLFGVFQRLHRAEDYPGTGVGLAIVQRIIHRHGGRVWAEGAVNQGATFYFTLSPGGES